MTPPLLQSRFAFDQPALLWGRARLRPDALELTGWGLGGRYRRRVPLEEILHTDVAGRDQFLLWLSGGEVLRLRLNHADAWRAGLRDLPRAASP